MGLSSRRQRLLENGHFYLAAFIVFSLFFALFVTAFTGPAHAWPVPDTGQTTCYDDVGNVITCPSPGQPFYGQDGNYTINPMSFTKLDGSGNALADSATSWAMVRDNVTGLIWEVKRNMDRAPHYDDPHDADNTYTWYDSNPATNGGNEGTQGDGTDTEDFIRKLNDDHFGGFTDWRMPTINELDSIVDLSGCNPAINAVYFPNTVASYYWISVTIDGDAGYAWGVSFYDGLLSGGDKSHYYYVRAVRGGQ